MRDVMCFDESMLYGLYDEYKNMELWGIEPQASWMQIKRSTNWAITPTDTLLTHHLNWPIRQHQITLSLDFHINFESLMSLTSILKEIDKVDNRQRVIYELYNHKNKKNIKHSELLLEEE